MKTVKEWFAQLPDLYKTECLSAALHYDSIMDLRESLGDAIAMSIPSWPDLDVEDLIKRANSGEFDAPAIPWPEEAAWQNAPEGTFARTVNEDGEVYFFFMCIIDRGKIADMTGIDWTKTLEYRPR
jgi:hypothetical protein